MDYFDILTKEEKRMNKLLLEAYEKEHFKKLNPNLKIENNEHGKLFSIGYKQLNSFQIPIIQECIEKGSGGLSLKVGSGKTIISILISLYLTMKTQYPILVVVSRSLISNWEDEIKKFFKDQLDYQVIHPTLNNIGQLKIKKKVIITTVDVLSKFYKENLIDKLFIKQVFTKKFGNYTNYYNVVTEPYLNHIIGGGLFYSTKWGSIIIDEAQIYTNIETLRCQALGALYSNHRWLLSGTLFDEPKVERILGYHVMLNAPNMPRNLPDTKDLLKNNFKGTNEFIIHRDSNLAFKPPNIHEQIVTHKLLPEEEKVYTMMKSILIQVKAKADKAKLLKDVKNYKLFSSYKLVMIMYLRQALICPLIPITSIAIDASDLEKRSELSKIIMNEIKQMKIDHYLNDKESIQSTRIKETLKILDKHKYDKVIVFSCFRTYLDIMSYLVKDLFVMHSEMSPIQRGDLIDDFRKSKNGILLMTYELGSTGLNLQCANVVLFIDFAWNSSKQKQGIGRILRTGQLATDIFIYFFTANTGIENIIFQKQYFKLQILEELKTGTSNTKIPKIKIDDVIKMIELEDNKTKLSKIKYI